MAKFKVGQPVWQIPHCRQSGWEAATVVGIYQIWGVSCVHCGKVTRGDTIYAMHFESGELPPSHWLGQWPHWAAVEQSLRPRDPDQFKAADEDFSLPLESFSLIKEVRHE